MMTPHTISRGGTTFPGTQFFPIHHQGRVGKPASGTLRELFSEITGWGAGSLKWGEGFEMKAVSGNAC